MSSSSVRVLLFDILPWQSNADWKNILMDFPPRNELDDRWLLALKRYGVNERQIAAYHSLNGRSEGTGLQTLLSLLSFFEKEALAQGMSVEAALRAVSQRVHDRDAAQLLRTPYGVDWKEAIAVVLADAQYRHDVEEWAEVQAVMDKPIALFRQATQKFALPYEYELPKQGGQARAAFFTGHCVFNLKLREPRIRHIGTICWQSVEIGFHGSDLFGSPGSTRDYGLEELRPFFEGIEWTQFQESCARLCQRRPGAKFEAKALLSREWLFIKFPMDTRELLTNFFDPFVRFYNRAAIPTYLSDRQLKIEVGNNGLLEKIAFVDSKS